jgi:hypothetical protein
MQCQIVSIHIKTDRSIDRHTFISVSIDPSIVTKNIIDGLAFELKGLCEFARDQTHIRARLTVEAHRSLKTVLDQEHIGTERAKVYHDVLLGGHQRYHNQEHTTRSFFVDVSTVWNSRLDATTNNNQQQQQQPTTNNQQPTTTRRNR